MSGSACCVTHRRQNALRDEAIGEVACRRGSSRGRSTLTDMATKALTRPNSEADTDERAAGRREARVVREYLEALRTNRPQRGRKRTPESLTKRLAAIDVEIGTADALAELRLVQERIDLQSELAAMNETTDLSALEAKFVAVAKSYSDRTGVSFTAWRTVGVPAATLTAAGITRGERRIS